MSFTEMIVQCIENDIVNIGDNGFQNIQEIFDFYKNVDDLTLVKIFDEYYGVEHTYYEKKKSLPLKINHKEE